jgi:hypothetical protein
MKLNIFNSTSAYEKCQYRGVGESRKNIKPNPISDAPPITASLTEWKSYIESLSLEQVRALRNKLRGVEYLIKIDRKLDEAKEEAY